MTLRSLTLLAALLVAGPAVAAAQTPTNPFLGSAAPPGPASPEPMPITIKEAIERGLQYNLGLLLQEASVTSANGARWRALEDLLPNVSGYVDERRQVLNLAVFGLPIQPSIVGPFNVFDARAKLSQPLIDLRAINDYRAASLNQKAEARGVKSARDLVVLVTVNLYLEAVTASSRIDVAKAQLATADALFKQASDLKTSGLVANVDVLRSQVQIQNQQQRLIAAENEFEKAKLQLGRAIGLPPGQQIVLTNKMPYDPLQNTSVDDALKRAFENRADFLAAQDRVAAAEATSKAASSELLPSLKLDADYGTIGNTVDSSHSTYTVAANVHIPIFEAGKAQARRAEADALIKQRRAELENVRGQVDTEVRSAMLDVQTAVKQLDAARTSQTLASEELEQARDRFAAGVTSNIEVTQAQESVTTASETYLAALYAHNVAKARLAQAVGIAESAIIQYLGGIQ